jgi:hypothetical protein
VEQIFNLKYIAERTQHLVEDGVRQVLLAGFGKNIHAFVRAAKLAGMRVSAIADDAFAAPGREYRGIQLVPLAAGLKCGYDAVVVSNTSPEQARNLEGLIRSATAAPVHRWFDYDLLASTPGAADADAAWLSLRSQVATCVPSRPRQTSMQG